MLSLLNQRFFSLVRCPMCRSITIKQDVEFCFLFFYFFTWSLNSINLKEKCGVFFSVFVLFFAQFVTRHAWLRHVLTGHKQINSGRFVLVAGVVGMRLLHTNSRKQQITFQKEKKEIRPKFSSWSIDIYSHTSAVWRYSPRSLCQQLFNCRFHQLRCSWAKKSLFEWINKFVFFFNQTINANLENAQWKKLKQETYGCM